MNGIWNGVHLEDIKTCLIQRKRQENGEDDPECSSAGECADRCRLTTCNNPSALAW